MFHVSIWLLIHNNLHYYLTIFSSFQQQWSTMEHNSGNHNPELEFSSYKNDFSPEIYFQNWEQIVDISSDLIFAAIMKVSLV